MQMPLTMAEDALVVKEKATPLISG